MIVSALATLAAGYLIYHFATNKTQLAYPPLAPNRLPLLGHILQFLRPIAVQELFRLWSLQIGPVFTLELGAKRWVVLNSSQSVKDLIVDRSTIYSSRDLPSTLVDDIMDGVSKGGGFAFYPYGPEWRRLRRIAHGGLVRKKINEYQPIFDDRRNTLLNNLWNEQLRLGPKDAFVLTRYIEHYTMTSILAIAFGNMCNFDAGDPRLHQAFALTERTAAIFGAAEQMAEFFPWFKCLLPNRKQEYMDVRNNIMDFYGGLLEDFRKRMELDPDSMEDCFIKEIIQKGELTDLQMMNFITVFVGAGSETTASTLEWMIALLANDPDIQDKVYDEIQKNVGSSRLPGPEDESNLPYLQCVIYETLRLRPPAPLSVPHATSEDDVYKGWRIPKNTTVIINLHAIHKDPLRYPNPDRFDPDRHLDYVQQQNLQRFSQTIDDRPHLAFSTGRRVCVGIHLAERSVYMAASALLACFRFERQDDRLVDVDTPKDLRSPTFAPSPYKVKLVPRHDGVKHLF